MASYFYKDNELYCDGVPIAAIAESVGTPFYLYSAATIECNYRAFEEALRGIPHLTCFAVKANSNLAILKLLWDLGSGFDIVSQGELYRLQKVGVDPKRILFSGVGKTEQEVIAALEAGILELHAESEQELSQIEGLAAERGIQADVALRVNPNVDPKTHPYIATGLQLHKFGIPIDAAERIYLKPERYPHLVFSGVSCHIGSQITELKPFQDAVRNLTALALSVQDKVKTLKHLDIGGGLGIRYNQESPPSIAQYAQMLAEPSRALGMTLLLEPGRSIVGAAGVLVTRVLLKKQILQKKFVVVDAGMNDLIRPTLYRAYHAIDPVRLTASDTERVDVVGPVCETGDFFAKDRPLPPVKGGDLLVIRDVGAYGYVQVSNYNSRRRPAEVLVQNGNFRVIRERESYEDLVRLERF